MSNNPTRIVFVLDVSGSMSEKLDALNIVVSEFINGYPVDFYVGIVLFSSTSWIEHEIKKIDDISRSSLLSKLPTKSYDMTDIGAGLLNGLMALTNAGLKTEGTILFLVTDGAHNKGPPYVEYSLPKLKSAKVIVNCIAYGNDADNDLERITKETGGRLYKAEDNCTEMAIRVIETCMRETVPCNEIIESMPIYICNDTLSINENLVSKQIVIDTEIGRNTCFSIQSSAFEKFTVYLVSPEKYRYDSKSIEYKLDTTAKKYKFDFKNASPGIWSVNFINQSKVNYLVNLVVISRSFSANAIKLHAYLKDPNERENMPALIFVELKQGSSMINQAEVKATVLKPNGCKEILTLQYNNHVFWAYFDKYDNIGRYAVNVIAKNIGTLSALKFQRQIEAGYFKIEEKVKWTSGNIKTIDNLISLKKYKTV